MVYNRVTHMPVPRSKTKPPKKTRRKAAPKRKSARPKSTTRIVCRDAAPVVARTSTRYRNALQVPSRMQLLRRRGAVPTTLVRPAPRPTLVPQVQIKPRVPVPARPGVPVKAGVPVKPGVPVKAGVPVRPAVPPMTRTGPRFVRIRDEYY